MHVQPIAVAFEAYSAEEFEGWCSGDPQVVEDLLRKVGSLGRNAAVIRNQLRDRMQAGRATPGKTGGGYNFAEVKFASLLIDRGWPRETVVYENYRLSTLAKAPGSGYRADGCKLVRRAFSDKFLDAFDRLVTREENGHLFRAKKAPLGSVVDLFAVDPGGGRVGVWEVKRFNPKTGNTEPIGAHQRAVLAFTRYLVDHMPGALRDGYSALDSGLVVFVPSSLPVARHNDAVADEERSCEFSIGP